MDSAHLQTHQCPSVMKPLNIKSHISPERSLLALNTHKNTLKFSLTTNSILLISYTVTVLPKYFLYPDATLLLQLSAM